MKTFHVKLDHDGIRELLSSGGMLKLVEGQAQSVASKANGDHYRGFSVSSEVVPKGRGGYNPLYQGRAMAWVNTSTPEAKRLQAQDMTLSKAVFSSGSVSR